MTQPEQEAREMLAACPFCGKAARTCPDTGYGAATVFCPDENMCGVQPVADAELKDGETLEDAIRRWNQRAFAARPTAGIDREVVRMREIANDWRRPALVQIEGPNDLKIYGGTIADDIDRWADMLEAPAKTGERGAKECQAVWRCAIGDVTSALDILKNRWINSKRKTEREAGAALAGICDLIWAARDPAPSDYNEANEQGKLMIGRVRANIEAEKPDLCGMCGERRDGEFSHFHSAFDARALSQPLPDAPIVGGEEPKL